MKRKSQNLSNLDKPLGKRNAYNLFFKYHRLLLLQSLSGSSDHHHHDHDLAYAASNMDVHHDHWSNHHDIVKDWKSQTVRPRDFPTFEKFMMHVLEIDLGLDDEEEGGSLITSDANSSIRRPTRTYLKKQKRPHTKKHGLMSLHNMARTIAQIWKEKRTEMEEIFRYFAELDDVRYERDLILYYSLLKVQDKNKNNYIDNNENSNILHCERQNQIHSNSFDSSTAASAYGNLPIFNFNSSRAYANANSNANMLPNVSTSSAFALYQEKVTPAGTTKKRRVEISPRPTSASSFWHHAWIEPKSFDSFSRSQGPVFSSDEASFLRKMLL